MVGKKLHRSNSSIPSDSCVISTSPTRTTLLAMLASRSPSKVARLYHSPQPELKSACILQVVADAPGRGHESLGPRGVWQGFPELQEVEMGLLDDLLGGLAGQGMGGRAQPEPTRAGGGGAGMSQALIALMPIVLGMLANRGSRGGSPTQMNYAPGG